MTTLDLGLMVLFVITGLGGYRQGFVRGVVRTLALLVVGLLSALVVWSLAPRATLGGSLAQAGVVLTGMLLAISIIAWLLNRLVAPHVHEARWNRMLGVVPALLQGVVLAAVVLGLAYRLAITPAQQAYIARGHISGPLKEPLVWLERTLAGS